MTEPLGHSPFEGFDESFGLPEPQGEAIVTLHVHNTARNTWPIRDVLCRDKAWWKSLITGKLYSWTKLQNMNAWSYTELRIWEPK